MKALIVAAGIGRRLGNMTKDRPKPLTKLLGLSLIERIILTAKQAGIKEFIIVVGYLGNRIKSELGDGKELGVKIEYVENKEYEKENGISVLKAKNFLNEKFILLMSDHVFDVRILNSLIYFNSNKSIVIAVDRRPPSAEDTRVLEKNGDVAAIGKNLKDSNCVDTGIFLCFPKIFSYIEQAVNDGNTTLSDGISMAIKEKDVSVFDITTIQSYESKMRKHVKPWWIDIDTVDDLREARKIIIENASKNPSDALAAYVHKPIENKLVGIISNFKITPNQLTVLVNILAYSVTALYFSGHLLTGIILAFIVGIADGLDGKLARVKLKTSKVGTLEHSFDMLFEFSWLIALAWYLFRATHSTLPLFCSLFSIVFITFYRHVYDQFRKAAGRSLDDSGDFERKFRRIAGRRNLYNIPILIGILLIPLYSLNGPIYSLVFILFHSMVTAVVYAARAIKHLREGDSEKEKGNRE